MTLRDIAKSAAAVLQADDIEYALDRGETGDDVRVIAKCVNMAVAEMSGDGFPLCERQVLTARDGVIPLSSFSRAPTGVRETTADGKRVAFTVDSLGVHVPRDGEYCVTYCFAFKDSELDDKAELGALCDKYVATYLTARNYCLITGRTDEASIWDQRYNAEAEKLRLTRRARIQGRKWL